MSEQTWQSLGGKGIVNHKGERRLWAIECMDDLNADHAWAGAMADALAALRKIGYDDEVVYVACSDIPLCQGIGPHGHAEDCAVGIAREALSRIESASREADRE